MDEISAAVRDALAEWRTWEPVEGASAHPSAGDLRAADALPHRRADRRVVFILRMGTNGEYADVLLVHSAPEMATDWDVIVPAAAASSPFDVVVQTDLRSVVLSSQLGKRMGHVDKERIFAAFNAASAPLPSPASPPRCAWWARPTPPPWRPNRAGTADTDGFSRGSMMTGSVDGRWSFKLSEGNDLRRSRRSVWTGHGAPRRRCSCRHPS